MARLIADGEVKILWVPGEGGIATPASPKLTEFSTGTEITEELGSLDTPLEGETVPARDLSSAYGKTVAGGFSGEITGLMYRNDDGSDAAWVAFPRGTTGWVVIRRFGGSNVAFAVANKVECWPVRIVSRSPIAMGDTAVQSFNVKMAGLDEPELAGVVVAGP